MFLLIYVATRTSEIIYARIIFLLDSTASQTLACNGITWRAYENTIARPLPKISDLSGVKPEKVNF